ncbi:MAG: TSUP family transporter, partial [Phycisphaerae bacterium]|nr:TSUP family transporter [Phycisphaerae bacterium]
AFGVVVGVFSGLMGLGGGSIMIPVMVLLMGFQQAKAHGMSLMVMCVPVMLPAVIAYFREGLLTRQDLWVAALIAAGFAGGSYFGAHLAFFINKYKGGLQITFGLLLIYVAAYTALGKENIARSLALSLLITVLAAVVIFGGKLLEKRSPQTPTPTAWRT